MAAASSFSTSSSFSKTRCQFKGCSNTALPGSNYCELHNAPKNNSNSSAMCQENPNVKYVEAIQLTENISTIPFCYDPVKVEQYKLFGWEEKKD